MLYGIAQLVASNCPSHSAFHQPFSTTLNNLEYLLTCVLCCGMFRFQLCDCLKLLEYRGSFSTCSNLLLEQENKGTVTLREDAVLKGNFKIKTAFRYLKTFAFRYLRRRTCEYCFVPSFTSSGCFQKSNLHVDKLSNENSNVEHYFSATA